MSFSSSNTGMATRETMQQEYSYVTPIEPSTSVMLIDSEDRVSGTPFQYSVDMGVDLRNVRQFRLSSATLPLLPNITEGITMQIEHALGTTAIFTIPTGLYNTSSFSNMLTATINAAYTSSGIVDTVTVSFDTTSRKFTITSVNALKFYIITETSSYVRLCNHFAYFGNYPSGTVVAGTSNSYTSEIAGLLPFRYLLITSSSLYQFNKLRSNTSSTQLESNIVGIINMVDLYDDTVWDITKPFAGVYRTLNLKNQPYIRTEQSTMQLPRNIDIVIKDGFSRGLDTVYPSESKLSIVLNFELIY